MTWEAIIAAAYSWRPQDLAPLEAFEVFHHVVLIRQRESSDRLWALSAASQPYRKEAAQREAIEAAAKIGKLGTRRRTPYELADDATRIEMIGDEIRLFGSAWIDKHPAEMRWLAERGITAEEAVRRGQKKREELDRQFAHLMPGNLHGAE